MYRGVLVLKKFNSASGILLILTISVYVEPNFSIINILVVFKFHDGSLKYPTALSIYISY